MENIKPDTTDQNAGLFAVILGPDGSGKSTVVARLLAESKAFSQGSWRFHWRPGLLPQPGRGAKQKTSASAPPPTEFAYGTAVSLLRYGYFLLDFVIGYWLRVYPRCKRGQLVIGERWYFDVLINPQRYGFRLPAWLLRFGGHLIPRPDLTVLLTADPDAIHERKQELTVQQITTQISAMQAILPDNPHGAEISTDTSLDESVAALLALLHETSDRLRRIDVWRAFPRFGGAKVLIADRDPVNVALQLYNPYSVAGRIAKRLAGLLPRVVTTSPIIPDVWRDDIRAISRLIRATMGEGDLDISFATGTPGPHRKMTAQIRHRGSVTAYVKVAQSAAAIELVKREAAALNDLELQARDQVVAPRVIAEADHGSYHLLFLSAPENTAHARPIEIDALDIAFIDALTPAVPAVMPLDAVWRKLFAKTRWDDDIVQAARLAIQSLVGSTVIRVTPAHGDYAPWNTLQLDGDRLYVFDWEYFSTTAPLLSDLFQRVFMPDWLVRRLPPGKAAHRLLHLRSDQRVQSLIDRLAMNENEFNACLLLYLLRQGLRNADEQGIPGYIRSCLHSAITQTETSSRQSHP